MIVDYGWIQTLLNGSLSYAQYNVNDLPQDTSSTGRIKSMDIKFNTKDVNYLFFTLTDVEDGGNGGNYFTYSTTQNGTYSNSLTFDYVSIPANGTIRVYIKCVDNYNETKHVKAKFVLTPVGQWNPPTWTSTTYGYDLYAVPANALRYRYYDSNGVERSAGDINNYRIGFIDLVLDLPFSFPNASFNISDAEPGSNGGNYFQYSFDNASWADSLTWNPGTVQNGSAVRVYVRFNDTGAGWRRVTSQLVTNGSIAGQARSLTSAVYGANISQGFGFRYYDNTGTERGYLINNYTIGFIDLTLPISDSSPNNTFNISDAEPSSNNGNFFQYSFDNANWQDNLSISNVTSARVYVRFNDNQSGVRRVTAQLLVSGTNLGQQTSIPYGAVVSQVPYVKAVVVQCNVTPDDQGDVYYNMRTGQCTVRVNTGQNSSAGTFYVGGEQWDTGLAWVGGGGDINTYISATQTFPNQANANIAQAGTVTASLSNVVGRGTVSITQMPSAANDFTVIVHIREKASGAANYTFNINTNAY